MPVPNPTPVYRLMHARNLRTLLIRGAPHAPNHTPADGLPYRTIHDVSVQASRRIATIPCGPGGTVHDYVSFYFGPLSPMLLRLKTGQVDGYDEGQRPLVYLVTTAQRVAATGAAFVFSDGHGLATFTKWFDDLVRLDAVDWGMVNQRYWSDNPEDNDRRRRKQAEFLVWAAPRLVVDRAYRCVEREDKDTGGSGAGRFPDAPPAASQGAPRLVLLLMRRRGR